MKYINPEKLMIGDVVCTTDLSPIADIIRWRTWGGWKMWGNLTLGTHVGIICDRGGGLFYVSEMLGDGLNMSELQRYDNGPKSWFNHFTRVGRHPLIGSQTDDGLQLRQEINDYIIKLHSFGVKYGYEDIMKFLWPNAPDNPYRMICSQWVSEVFKAVKITLPLYNHQNPFISPADWQRWEMLETIDVRN